MCNVHGNIWEERGPDYRFLRILEPEPGCFSEEERLRAINGPLIDWYREHARDLPWRKDRDAYHVWISEIMLQQTRVEAVKPYYLRFMEAFPNAEALAGAEDEVLLKMWEGLGYYSRARNLKRLPFGSGMNMAGNFRLPEKSFLRSLGLEAIQQELSLPLPSVFLRRQWTEMCFGFCPASWEAVWM